MISQRLRGVKEDGEAIEEEGFMPKLQAMFSEVGISIEDQNGELRSTFDILNDLAGVWDQLSSKQKQYFGEKVAGNRQVKTLNAIMQNWDVVADTIDKANNSQGAAIEGNEMYMESIAGKITQLKSAWQELATETISGDFVKGFVELGTALTKVVTSAGGLIPILTTISGIIVVIKGAKIAKGLGEIGAAFKNLFAGMSGGLTVATSWVGAILAIVGVIAAVSSAINSSKKSFQDFQQATSDSKSELAKEQGKLEELNTELENTKKLISELDGKKLSIVEQDELNNLREKNTQLENEIALQKTLIEIREKAARKAAVEEYSENKDRVLGNSMDWSNYQITSSKLAVGTTQEVLLDYAKDNIVNLKERANELKIEYESVDRDLLDLFAEEDHTYLNELKESSSNAAAEYEEAELIIASRIEYIDSLIGDLERVENPITEADRAFNALFDERKELANLLSEAKSVDAPIDKIVEMVFDKYSEAAKKIKEKKKELGDAWDMSEIENEMEGTNKTIAAEAKGFIDALSEIDDADPKQSIGDLLEKVFMTGEGAGGVDVLNRPILHGSDMLEKYKEYFEGFEDDVVTYFSHGEAIDVGGIPFQFTITPVGANGEVYSEEEIANYIDELLDKSTNIEEFINNDKQGNQLILHYTPVIDGDFDAAAARENLFGQIAHALSMGYDMGLPLDNVIDEIYNSLAESNISVEDIGIYQLIEELAKKLDKPVHEVGQMLNEMYADAQKDSIGPQFTPAIGVDDVQIYSTTEAYKTLTKAIDEQNKAGVLSSETIKTLINSEDEGLKGLANCLEQTANGYVLNTDSVYDYIKAQDEEKKLDINAAIMEREVALNDLIKKLEELRAAEGDHADEISAIESEISSNEAELAYFRSLKAEIDNATDALLRYQAAKKTPNEDEEHNEGQGIYSDVQSMYKEGKVGSDDFQEGMSFLLGDNWLADANNNVEKAYKNAKQIGERYFGKDDAKDANNFAKDLVGKGLAEYDENGNLKMLADVTLPQVAEEFGMSEAAARSLFELLNSYSLGDKITFDEDVTSAEDLEVAQEKLKEKTEERKKAEKELQEMEEKGLQNTPEYEEKAAEVEAITKDEKELSEAIDTVNESMGETDTSKMTLADAIAELDTLQQTITTLNTNGLKVPTELLNYKDEVEDRIAELKAAEEKPPHVTAEIDAHDKTEDGVGSANANLETVDDETANIFAANQTEAGVNAANENLENVSDSETTNLYAANQTEAGVDAAKESLKEVPNKETTTVKAEPDEESISDAQGAIDGIKQSDPTAIFTKIDNNRYIATKNVLDKLGEPREVVYTITTEGEVEFGPGTNPEDVVSGTNNVISKKGDSWYLQPLENYLSDTAEEFGKFSSSLGEFVKSINQKLNPSEGQESDAYYGGDPQKLANEFADPLVSDALSSTLYQSMLDANEKVEEELSGGIGVDVNQDNGPELKQEVEDNIPDQVGVEVTPEPSDGGTPITSNTPGGITRYNSVTGVNTSGADGAVNASRSDASKGVAFDVDANTSPADSKVEDLHNDAKKPETMHVGTVVSRRSLDNAIDDVNKDYEMKVTIKTEEETPPQLATGTRNAKGGLALVDDGTGAELIEHVKSGTYELGTNNGPRFTKLDKGDVVHTAEETRKILSRAGQVGGFFRDGLNKAKAVVGNAFAIGVGGGVNLSQLRKQVTSSVRSTKKENNGKNKQGKVSDKAIKKFEKWANKLFDWAEIKLERLKTITTTFLTDVQDAIGAVAKNKILNKAMKSVGDQIEATNKAYNLYIKQANTVAKKGKLSKDIVSKIQNGSIDITKYSKNVQTVIKEYQTWYDKALNCVDALNDLNEQQKELATQRLDNLINQYDTILQRLDRIQEKSSLTRELKEETGKEIYEYDYDQDIKSEKSKIAKIQKAREDLEKELQEEIDAGYVKKGDDTWNKYQDQLKEYDNQVIERQINLAKLEKEQENVEIGNLDRDLNRLKNEQRQIEDGIELTKTKGIMPLDKYNPNTSGPSNEWLNNIGIYSDAATSKAWEYLKKKLGVKNVGDLYNSKTYRKYADIVNTGVVYDPNDLGGSVGNTDSHLGYAKSVLKAIDKKIDEYEKLQLESNKDGAEYKKIGEELDKLKDRKKTIESILIVAEKVRTTTGNTLKEIIEDDLGEPDGFISNYFTTQYENLISNAKEQNKVLEEQNKLYAKQQKGFDINSDAYQELSNKIQDNNENINDNLKNIENWKDAIEELPFTVIDYKMDQLADSIEAHTTKAELLNATGGSLSRVSQQYEHIEDDIDKELKLSKQRSKLYQKKMDDMIEEYGFGVMASEDYLNLADKLRTEEQTQREMRLSKYQAQRTREEMAVQTKEYKVNKYASAVEKSNDNIDIKQKQGQFIKKGDYQTILRNINKQKKAYVDEIELLKSQQNGRSTTSERYQELQDKINSCEDAYRDLEITAIETQDAIDKMPIDVQERALNRLKVKTEELSDKISINAKKGIAESKSLYNSLISNEEKQKNRYQNEIDEYTKLMDALVTQYGETAKQSDKYIEMENAVADLNDKIRSSTENILDWNQAIANIPVNELQWKIDELSESAEGLNYNLDTKNLLGKEVIAKDYNDLITNAMWTIVRYQELNEELFKQQKGMDKYSEAYQKLQSEINSNNSSIRQLTQSTVEWRKAIENIKIDQLQWQLNALGESANRMSSAISLHEAQGVKETSETYKNMINNGMQQINILEQQNKLYKEQQKNMDANSEAYQELQDKINSNISQIEQMKIAQEDWNDSILDLGINNIEEYKDAISKTNDEYKKQKELKDAILELEKAQIQRKSRVYIEGQGFVYQAKEEDLINAQEKLEDVITDQLLDRLDNLINALEEAKKDTNVYDANGNLLGSSYKTPQLNNLTNILSAYYNKSATLDLGILKDAFGSKAISGIKQSNLSNATNLTIGDIVINNASNGNELAKAIVDQFPNALLQALYKK